MQMRQGLEEGVTILDLKGNLLDQPLGKALLRSDNPTVRGGKSFFYEVVLERSKRSAVTLRRYEADRKRRLGIAADQPHRIKYRKLTK